MTTAPPNSSPPLPPPSPAATFERPAPFPVRPPAGAALPPLLLSVWQLLVNVLIPASLSSDASRSLSAQSLLSLRPRAALLRPCDLVLVRTPGRLYALCRRLSHQAFDHLAVVMDDGRVLHVGPPRIRLLPAELLMQPRRHPRVLRPRLTEAEAAAFLASLKALLGQPYDTLKVVQFIAQLTTRQYRQQRRSPSPALPPSVVVIPPSSSLICTDAILNRLLSASTAFRALLTRESAASPALDVLQLSSWSINDLHRLAQGEQRHRATQQQQQQQRPEGGGSLDDSALSLVPLPPLREEADSTLRARLRLAPRARGRASSLAALSSAALSAVSLAAVLRGVTALLPSMLRALPSSALSFLAVLAFLHPLLPGAYLGPAILLVLSAALAAAARSLRSPAGGWRSCSARAGRPLLSRL